MPPQRCCLFSPSRALRSVFMQQPIVTGSSITNIATTTTTITHVPLYLLSPRLFSSSSSQLFIRSRPKPPTAAAKQASRLPSDNAIPYKWIRIAGCREHGLAPENPDSNSDLSGPQLTKDILKGLNRQKYSLVMVALPSRNKKKDKAKEEEEEEEETLESLAEKEMKNIPVCRIIDKYAYAKAADEKEKAARKKELNRKEMELNWAIAPNDLQHRIKQFRKFLSEGKRIEVLLAKKKGGRAATKEEGETLLSTLRQTAEEEGGKEVKMDGHFPKVVNIVFEGKAVSG